MLVADLDVFVHWQTGHGELLGSDCLIAVPADAASARR
jgi:hypothetical protein